MQPIESSGRARALAGTSFIFILLAFTRWGSNIGYSPLFISDVLIAVALFQALATANLKADRVRTGWVPSSTPTLLFGTFLAYVVLRSLFSIGNGPILDVIRDSLPFLYGFLAFLSAYSVARSTAEDRTRTMKILWWALIIHLAWLVPVVVLKLTEGLVTVPFAAAPLFQVRPDIDAAITAVTAGLLLRQILMRKAHRFWSFVALVLTAVIVLNLKTRAGLLSYGIAIVVACIISYAAMPKKHPRRTAMMMAIPAVLVLAAVIIPQTTPGQRLIATIDPAQALTLDQRSADGTAQARASVWTGVIDWVGEDTGRTLVGSGFGNDFLTQSGTLSMLEGTEYSGVRSPHDWFVGIYARMGLIGLVLSVLICLGLLARIWRRRQFIGEEPVFFLSAMLIVAILPVASLGVVLEAPFGAIPFFWAAGILYTLRTPRKHGPLTEQPPVTLAIPQKTLHR